MGLTIVVTALVGVMLAASPALAQKPIRIHARSFKSTLLTFNDANVVQLK